MATYSSSSILQGMIEPILLSVHTGAVAPLGPRGIRSAFVKASVQGPLELSLSGLRGDEQADLRFHGGPEKAVYAYAARHYSAWRAEFPECADRFVAGGVGENLAIDGLDELDLCVGDIHAIGTAELQVCQPRQPCFKLALRFENSILPKAMVASGRSGWYYRVVKAGIIAAGDPVVLRGRPHPEFPFTTLIRYAYHGNASVEELRQLAGLEGAASQWRHKARKALSELRYDLFQG